MFLDEVHYSCLIIQAANKRVAIDTLKSADRAFRRHRNGLQGKLETLKDKFSIEIKEPLSLVSINKTRNCLVHRRGIVSRDDCNDGDNMTVTWRGIDLHIETESGETVSIHPITDSSFSQQIVVPAKGWIKGIYCKRKKAFPFKSGVSFSTGELAEICYYFIDCTKEVVITAQEYANRYRT